MIRFTTEAPQSYVSPLEVLDDNIPVEFRITEMYPNPFNPKINFTVRINSTNSVSINIIDIIGRDVATLHNGSMITGNYNFSWDGDNYSGNQVSSGTYFLVVKGQNESLVKKMLFLK